MDEDVNTDRELDSPHGDPFLARGNRLNNKRSREEDTNNEPLWNKVQTLFTPVSPKIDGSFARDNIATPNSSCSQLKSDEEEGEGASEGFTETGGMDIATSTLRACVEPPASTSTTVSIRLLCQKQLTIDIPDKYLHQASLSLLQLKRIIEESTGILPEHITLVHNRRVCVYSYLPFCPTILYYSFLSRLFFTSLYLLCFENGTLIISSYVVASLWLVCMFKRFLSP